MTQGKGKAAARVAQEIVQTIYDLGLNPGDRYLSEAEALARHGVSRATFREALRFLELQGVVRVRAGPGGGTIVDRPDWPNLTSTFALLLQFAGASLKDVMEARTALEPSMAALAAERADPSTIAQLAAILQEARDGLPDQGRFLHAYRTFWMLTAKATGNAVTALLWPALRALVDSGGFVPNEIYREVLVKRMSSLLDALTAADSDAARRIVAEMDVESTKRLVDLYPKRVSRRVGWADVPID